MANLKSGTLIGGNMIWHAGNVPLDYTNGRFYIDGKLIYTNADKPSPADIGAVSKAGDTMTGNLVLPVVNATSAISYHGKSVVGGGNDGWLRFNPNANFNLGVYFANSRVRTDGRLEVGDNGSQFSADGNGVFEFGQRVYSPNNKQTTSVINDIRSADRLPSYFAEKTATFWFNNTGMPSNAWYSGLHVKGWSGAYNSWQLFSNSNTGTSDNKLYFRTGNNDAWNATAEVYTTLRKPSAADVGALPLTGGTINGNLTVSGQMHSNNVVANVDIIVSGIGGIANNGGQFRAFSNEHLFMDAAQNRGFYAGNNFTYDGTWKKRDAAHPSGMITVEPGALYPRFLRSDAGHGSPTQYAYNIYHTGYKPTAADIGAPAIVNNTIEIPSLNGGPTGCVKIQGTGDSTEAWMTTGPNSDSSHRGIGIGHGSGPMYWTGSTKYYLLHSNVNRLRNGSDWGAGFLADGTSGKPWIAGYFGDAAGTGGRVVLGTLKGSGNTTYATIGAHNAALNAWDKLVINGGANGNQTTYIGMYADSSSGSGNLFVGNDIEANYMRIRSAIPNDNRYVVNKGYVDSTFAKLAYREDWANKGIHTQTASGLAWQHYGNGHQIIDASKGTYEGISFSRIDSQSTWDSVNGPTLVGWNGQNTYGVRVDRCRRADYADKATYLAGGAIGTGTDGASHKQLIFVNENTAMIGAYQKRLVNYLDQNNMDSWAWRTTSGGTGTADKMVLDKSGNLSTSGQIVSGSRCIATSVGNDYGAMAFEARGNGSTNTVFPGVGFHQPGVFAGSLQMRNADQFWFYKQGASTRADVVVRQLYANGNVNIEGSSNLSFSTHGGGWYMSDSTWIRATNHKQIYTGSTSDSAFHTAGGCNIQGRGYFGGNVECNDAYIRSDIRLKSNLKPLENALDKIKQLNAYSYDKKKSLDNDEIIGREVGIIAQDLQKVLPEAVNDQEILTISNSGVNALLLQAIKELKAELDELKSANNLK